ncbi:MAG: flagellar type III secretion system pore protein FliP [Armatimonadota bacterium]
MGVLRKAGTLAFGLTLTACGAGHAQQIPIAPKLTVGLEQAKGAGDVSVSIQVLILLTVLSLAPAILLMLTSFTRIVIVLSFARSALGTQQVPPNPVLMGLALFLTAFTMAPVWDQVNTQAVQPYLARHISYKTAVERAVVPVREFMFRQTREKDLSLFVYLSGKPRPATPADVPTRVLIPAFMISELKTAFIMGFLIFIPFLIVDAVVSVVLMSVGMMMVPPTIFSLPFKILLFVMVDGWHLISRSLALSFH